MHKKLFGLCFSLIATLCFAGVALAKEKIEIADNAPDSYVVRKGDTLWGISGKFLKQPWRWPEVWSMNKAEIRNPHLIYPGQTVYLDRNGPRLSLGKHSGTSGDEKLSPQIYATSADAPITSVSLDAIRNFLAEPLIDESGDDSSLPTVVAFEENRVVAGMGQSLFAKNLGNITDQWSLYRRGSPIKDPETDKILGYEAVSLGSAVTVVPAKNGKVAELRVTKAQHEISVGDRLMPAAKSELMAFAPHAPAPGTHGLVASIYRGASTSAAGRYSVISVNLGKNDGLEPGHVLGIDRNRGTVVYEEDGSKEKQALPDGRIGLAFVFRVFNRISYALVMEANNPVYVGDKIVAP